MLTEDFIQYAKIQGFSYRVLWIRRSHTVCSGSKDLFDNQLVHKSNSEKEYNHKIVEENIKHKTIKMSTQEWLGYYYSYSAPNVSKVFM